MGQGRRERTSLLSHHRRTQEMNRCHRDASLLWRLLPRGIREGSILNGKGSVYKPGVIRNHESALRVHALPQIGSLPVMAFTKGDMQRLIDRVGFEKSAGAARLTLGAARVVFRHCMSWGEIDRNPCAGVKPPTAPDRRPPRILERDETTRVLAAAEADDLGSAWRPRRSFAGPLVTLTLGTGIRQGEGLSVEWGCVASTSTPASSHPLLGRSEAHRLRVPARRAEEQGEPPHRAAPSERRQADA
jgi:integrase